MKRQEVDKKDLSKALGVRHVIEPDPPPPGVFTRRLLRRVETFECMECGEGIPPGKPDRKCKACREKPNDGRVQ